MAGILDWLSGKKTYITAFLFGVFNLGLAFGWWTADNSVITAIDSILAALGLGFLRAGVAKSGGGGAAAVLAPFLLVPFLYQGASAQELGTTYEETGQRQWQVESGSVFVEPAPDAPPVSYWELEPSLLTGFVKVVDKGDGNGTLGAEIFASAGIGVMYSLLDATDPEDITSTFGYGAHLMFGGDTDDFRVTIALPTLSFFDGFLMVSGTYDFGNVNGRSRFGGLVGTNFEGILKAL